MKKIYASIFLLLSVSATAIGMENKVWIFNGLSEEDSDLFAADMNNGLIATHYIRIFNELEEKRTSDPVNFSAKDRHELAEAKDTLELIGLGEFSALDIMKKDFRKKKQQEKKERAAWPIALTGPKVKRRLVFVSSSSSSSEEEMGTLHFVNYSAQEINKMSSGSDSDSEEECDYDLHNHLSMLKQMIEFSQT